MRERRQNSFLGGYGLKVAAGAAATVIFLYLAVKQREAGQ
jgi:hypothetical protein